MVSGQPAERARSVTRLYRPPLALGDLPVPPAKSPFLQPCPDPSRGGNRFANQVNRTQSRNQNQRGRIDSHHENKRADWTKGGAEQATMFVGQAIADQAAGPLNVHW